MSCKVWGCVVTSGRGEVVGKEDRNRNKVKKGEQMYVNAKMVPVETIPGMRGRGGQRRMVEGV
jgi:hypothetical protein